MGETNRKIKHNFIFNLFFFFLFLSFLLQRVKKVTWKRARFFSQLGQT